MDNEQKTKIVKDVSDALNPIITDLQKFISDVVKAVEIYNSEVGGLSGQDKQEVAVSVLNSFVKLPFPFSLFQGVVLKLLVNHIVHKLNSTGNMPKPSVTGGGIGNLPYTQEPTSKGSQEDSDG